jgi:hypothetical protein
METFNSDGSYNKTDWENGDIITADKLNKIEDAIYEINADNDNFVTTSDFGAALSRKANTNHTHSNYATKTELDNAIANANLPEYVTEDELNQSLRGYATEQYVNDAITNANLTNYVTEDELSQSINEINQNLENYATKQYVNDIINEGIEITYTDIRIELVYEYPANEDPNVLYIKVSDENEAE